MEAAIREEPRVFEREVRESFKAFVASSGNHGLSDERIRACLGILEACERNGIAATFASLNGAVARGSTEWLPQEVRVSVAPDAERNRVFDELIRNFAAGHAMEALAREAKALIPDLPILPRRACVALAMICSSRAGDAVQARRWAVQLNAHANEWGVPGLPSQSLGPVVKESTDFEPIVETLHWITRGEQGTVQEREAIRSLIRRYAEAQKMFSARKGV